jgi:cytochrome c-type biogenesis protein CcmH/NrfG
MSGLKQIFAMRWTRERAALLAFVCLAAGVAGGWSVRGLRSPDGSSAAAASVPVAATTATDSSSPQTPSPSQLKEMADAQAAPLVQKLISDPSNPELLSAVGNLYYDARQYPVAADYYARALRLKPEDAAMRTDMGTAFWFMGNADKAIAEFDKALTSVPNNPNTLFNLGLVKWKGKKDAAGATAAWQKLLATTPNYEGKSQVEQMLAEVKSQATPQPPAKDN